MCLFQMEAWPPVLLLEVFSRTTHPNSFTMDTALPWVLSNTPAKCEVDQINDCRDNRQTDSFKPSAEAVGVALNSALNF